MLFAGTVIGAVDALRLMTKGPGPPRRVASGKGASKSSMVRCQISPVIGVFFGAAMNLFRMRLECRDDSG